jgi:hypothetical protein
VASNHTHWGLLCFSVALFALTNYDSRKIFFLHSCFFSNALSAEWIIITTTGKLGRLRNKAIFLKFRILSQQMSGETWGKLRKFWLKISSLLAAGFWIQGFKTTFDDSSMFCSKKMVYCTTNRGSIFETSEFLLLCFMTKQNNTAVTAVARDILAPWQLLSPLVLLMAHKLFGRKSD